MNPVRHHPDCDLIQVGPDGIEKPCNCGVADLERQLAEAQAQTERVMAWKCRRDEEVCRLKEERDALKAHYDACQDHWSNEEQAWIRERDALKTTLVRLSPTLSNDPRPHTTEEMVTIVEAEYHALVQDHAKLEGAVEQAREVLRELASELVSGARTLYHAKAILAHDRDWLIAKAQKAARSIATLDRGEAVAQHGTTCPKIMHNLTGGYLHGANDDRPYDVDGVGYCGRCHVALDVGKEAGG